VASTRGCRLAWVAGLILGMLAVLGAQAGFPHRTPGTSLLRSPVPGSRPEAAGEIQPPLHADRLVACTQCHHEYQGRRNVWHEGLPVDKCQACHGPRPEARRLDLKNAYHRQCKGCHLRLRQQARPSGPIELPGLSSPP